MRLDIFLPFLRKPKKGLPPAPDPLVLRAAKQLLPSTLFADRATGKPGIARRWLKWLGPAWLSSPVRRISQALCLLLFLWLFFYVCYPYDARPSQEWRGWQPTSIEADGTIVLRKTGTPTNLQSGASVYAAQYVADQSPEALGPIIVVNVDGDRLRVRPAVDFPADKVEELRFDLGGPWILSENPPRRLARALHRQPGRQRMAAR